MNLPNSTTAGRKTKFWKRRWVKITSLVLGLFLIFVIAWGVSAYTLASKMFTTNFSGGSSLLNLFNKDQLKGEGDGRVNFVLTGIGGSNHPGGTLTDSIMVLSLDPTNKSMAMLSIPRDLYVKTTDKSGGKINEVYSKAEKNGKGKGGEAIKKAVGEILDLPIHYYINVDFEGFVKIIDTLGGITVDVEKALYDSSYPDKNMIGYDPLKIKAGSQKMDGALALKYARSRETTSDFDRSRRQQQVLQAVQEKAFSIGFLANPKKTINTVSILGNHLKTDLSAKEIERLLSLLKDLDRSKTVSKVLTNGPGGELYSDRSSGTFYLYPNGNSYTLIQRIAHEIFSDPDLKRENARIEVLNGSKTAGVALTLADTLKSYGYNIVSTEKTDFTAKTVIYDYSNGSKKDTLNFLKSRLNSEVVTKTKNSTSINDIVVIVGDDYKDKNVDLKESP